MPKMGESVSEATIISWTKEIGEMIEMDETIIEIATDKVDSEVPSTHEGKLVEKLFNPDDVVQVGQPFAIIEIEGDNTKESENSNSIESKKENLEPKEIIQNEVKELIEKQTNNIKITNSGERFYSPLVKSIAIQEKVTENELEKILGTGKDGRVTKTDMINFLKNRDKIEIKTESPSEFKNNNKTTVSESKIENKTPIPNTGEVEIIEMDRMRKLISAHMTMSKSTSAHITSMVEVDMTNIVNWRNSIKNKFKEREGQNITFTPIIIEAMAKAVKDFPLINVSVDGTNIHIHKNVNIGMAAALPDGNLIVPVIKECQNKNLVGITKSVNDLAKRARASQLNPDDIQGGTITMTNVGTFGNVMGTPIINQPQVAIMAAGAIRKKPAVLETEYGDVIAIRHMMFLSLSYDHRVVDGALGGQFVRKVGDYLEQFDIDQKI